MTVLGRTAIPTSPRVTGDLPGPRSAELLAARIATSPAPASTHGTCRSPSTPRPAALSATSTATSSSTSSPAPASSPLDTIAPSWWRTRPSGSPVLPTLALLAGQGRLHRGSAVDAPHFDAGSDEAHFCGPTEPTRWKPRSNWARPQRAGRHRRVPWRLPRRQPRRDRHDRLPTKSRRCPAHARRALLPFSLHQQRAGSIRSRARPSGGYWRTFCPSLTGVCRPAAVIMELVQGEGGVSGPACFRAAGAGPDVPVGRPLVIDRCKPAAGGPEPFAFQQYDIEPDMIVASKALSGWSAGRRDHLRHQDLDRLLHRERTPEPTAGSSRRSLPVRKRCASSVVTMCWETYAAVRRRSPSAWPSSPPIVGCVRYAGWG